MTLAGSARSFKSREQTRPGRASVRRVRHASLSRLCGNFGLRRRTQRSASIWDFGTARLYERGEVKALKWRHWWSIVTAERVPRLWVGTKGRSRPAPVIVGVVGAAGPISVASLLTVCDPAPTTPNY